MGGNDTCSFPDYRSIRKSVPLCIGSRDLIELHYGFVDGKLHFLSDMAKQFGLSMYTLAVYNAKVVKPS